MDTVWSDIDKILSGGQFDKGYLRTVLSRMYKLLNRNVLAPNDKGTILTEIKSALRALKARAKKHGEQIILETLKCLLHKEYFGTEVLNAFLSDHRLSYQYVTADKCNIRNGRFIVMSVSLQQEGEKTMPDNNRFEKVFISHSSMDIDYVKAFVTLFEAIGLNEKTLFCSSIEPYGIPLSGDIYEYIRDVFTVHHPYVFFILSENFYHSAACLNEMGAAWTVRSDYLSVLLPGFEYEHIKGAIDAGKISLKLSCREITLRNRMTELRNTLQKGLGLEKINEIVWNNKLDDFITAIRKANKNHRKKSN